MSKVIQGPVVSKEGKKILPSGAIGVVNHSSSFVVEDELSTNPEMSPECSAKDAEILKLRTELETSHRRLLKAEGQLEEFQEVVETLKTQAKSDGYEQGLAIACTENDQECERQRKEIETFLKGFQNQWDELWGIAEDSAAEIAFSAVCKIFGSISNDTKLLESYIKQAVDQLINRKGLVVYVSPKNLPKVEQIVRNNRRDWADIEFKSDQGLGVGDCKIACRNGSLDLRMDQILAALKTVLLVEREKSMSRRLGNGLARTEIN